MTSSFRLANQLQRTSFAAFTSDWLFFSRPIALQLDQCASRQLGMCTTQQWTGVNLFEKENFNRVYKLGSQAELSQFATNFNLSKSEGHGRNPSDVYKPPQQINQCQTMSK